MNVGHKLAAAAAILALASVGTIQADPISTEAADNATVQPAGQRAGGSGKAFLNIEGSANGTFASYGVADFNFGVLPPVISVNSARLDLTQANAAFSTNGGVVFALDQSAVLADIQPGTSPLAFDGVDPGHATDEGQGDLSLLAMGGGVFTVIASGTVDSYPLTLTPPNAAQIVNRINNGQTIRIVIGTVDPTVAATWAGHTNSTYVGPTLHLNVIFDTGTPARANSWGRIKAIYR